MLVELSSPTQLQEKQERLFSLSVPERHLVLIFDLDNLAGESPPPAEEVENTLVDLADFFTNLVEARLTPRRNHHRIDHRYVLRQLDRHPLWLARR